MDFPGQALQMQSTVREDATVIIELGHVAVRPPQANEVVVRMEAAPINPSDLGIMFAGAGYDSVRAAESAYGPAIVATLSPDAASSASGRVGHAVPLGGEGAGIIVAAGSDADDLIGKTVALRGQSYSQFRTLNARECLVLPDGVSPERAASCFVNPLTVLGIVETARAEGHAALVNTAAASNLGQMLQRLCLAENMPLVNIVRSREAEDVLRKLGAQYVVDSTSEDFEDNLTKALAETEATVAFDATGGGELAGAILAAMERVLVSKHGASGYGSAIHKQVYLYGMLTSGPTILHRRFGMAWGVGGWLLTNFLNRIGEERTNALKLRVAAEIEDIFASHYSDVLSLAEVLTPDAVTRYSAKSTRAKALIALQRI